MKGPAPKPVEVRRAEGNPAKRRLPEVIHVGGLPDKPPDPPDYLPDDAQDFWQDTVPMLHKRGLVDSSDLAALEQMATAYARFREAQRVIAKEGLTSYGSQGQTVEHPAVATERNAMAMFLRYAEHHGLTPVARTRLGLAQMQGQQMLDNSRPKPKLTKVE